MVHEIRLPGKLSLADAAPVRFLSRVQPFVTSHIRKVSEQHHTNFTLERFFSSVNSQMQLQRGGQIETLGAHGTNIRPFAGMNSHMNFEVAHPSEPFLAGFALKRPFASVRSHMTI